MGRWFVGTCERVAREKWYERSRSRGEQGSSGPVGVDKGQQASLVAWIMHVIIPAILRTLMYCNNAFRNWIQFSEIAWPFVSSLPRRAPTGWTERVA